MYMYVYMYMSMIHIHIYGYMYMFNHLGWGKGVLVGFLLMLVFLRSVVIAFGFHGFFLRNSLRFRVGDFSLQ